MQILQLQPFCRHRTGLNKVCQVVSELFCPAAQSSHSCYIILKTSRMHSNFSERRTTPSCEHRGRTGHAFAHQARALDRVQLRTKLFQRRSDPCHTCTMSHVHQLLQMQVVPRTTRLLCWPASAHKQQLCRPAELHRAADSRTSWPLTFRGKVEIAPHSSNLSSSAASFSDSSVICNQRIRVLYETNPGCVVRRAPVATSV